MNNIKPNKLRLAAYILSLASLTLTGCASTRNIEPVNMSPSAVVTITANNRIKWEAEESSSTLSIFNKDQDDEKESTQPLLKDAENALMINLKNKGFYVIPASYFTGSPSYQNAQDNKELIKNSKMTPLNYKLISAKDKLNADFSKETGAISFIYADYAIHKILTSGSEKKGKITASVLVTVEIYDVKGTLIKKLTGYEKGDTSIPIVSGAYDEESLAQMYPYLFDATLKAAFNSIK